MQAATVRAKRRPRKLNDNQIKALGTLYDAWWQNPEQKIRLLTELEVGAESLVTLGLITKFPNPPYHSTYKITQGGRRRYEEVNPKKAAQSRQCWSDSAVSEQILRMLRALGYEAELHGEDFNINQEGAAHLLSRREVANLLACSLKHPLPLHKHRKSESHMTSFSLARYSFPTEG
jgi:hypothetical protein